MKWQFDAAHTTVEASAKHMMFATVRVRFPGATGEIDFDPDRPEAARVRVTIPVSSLSSGDEKRDGHLRSADFFDLAKHAEIVFTSTAVRPAAGGAFRVSGDLTIRGTTKPVVADVTLHTIDDPMVKGAKRSFIDAKTTIDRRDWGLVWNMPVPQGVLVGHEIAIDVSAEVMEVVAASRAA
ncbi:MAG: YceI family protein [Chloroflexi bacterium]|nr:YceI family protein [Chloroflexota bacterium]